MSNGVELVAVTETISTAEAAARLGVSVQKLHRLTASKGITPVFQAPGIRGAKFWRPSDVEALAAEQGAA